MTRVTIDLGDQRDVPVTWALLRIRWERGSTGNRLPWLLIEGSEDGVTWTLVLLCRVGG